MREPDAVLLINDSGALVQAWQALPDALRQKHSLRRPVLMQMEGNASRQDLVVSLELEEALKMKIGKLAWDRFENAWSVFRTRWRQDETGELPHHCSWLEQHQAACNAATRYELTLDPLGGPSGREDLVAEAILALSVERQLSAERLERLCPPASELLPI